MRVNRFIVGEWPLSAQHLLSECCFCIPQKPNTCDWPDWTYFGTTYCYAASSSHDIQGEKNKQKNNRNIISWQLSLRSHFSVIVSPLSLYQYSVCICLCAEAQSNAAQRLTDGWLMRRWCRFKGVAKRRKCRCAIKMQIIKICIQLIPSSVGSGNIDAFVMKTPWSLAPVFSRAAAALKISRVIISGFSLQQLCLRKCHLSHSLCVLEILILVYNGTWNNKVR